MIELTSFFSVN